MTTKNISSTENRPTSDATGLPPGPASAKSSKPEREFSSVMDQAVARKSAHSRSTRSSARGRGEDTPAAHSRGRTSREAEAKPEAKAQSKSAERMTKVDSKVTGQDQEQQRPEPIESGKPDQRNIMSEAEEPESEDAMDLAQTADESAKEEEVESPSNIVPFPGAMAATAVIIPFPLMAAQVSIDAGSEAQVKSVARGATPVASTETASVTEGEVIIPFPRTEGAEASRAAVNQNATADGGQSGGIDVNALGLKPVSERESAEMIAGPAAPSASAMAANSAGAESSKPNVIEVAFRSTSGAGVAQAPTESAAKPQAQLPGDPAKPEESAPSFSVPESSAKIVLLRTDAAKTATGAGLGASAPSTAGVPVAAGIAAAKQDVRMESTMSSEREKVAAGRGDLAVEELAPTALSPSERASSASDVSARSQFNGEWQTGRSISSTDRTGFDSQETKAIDGTGTVERISSLIARESALVKKHGSDSMAVVLRPDAETELFVHLSNRNGQIEATVRCERGDVQHLGALWSQLQESLGQHKVRLAPLQETPTSQSNFNQSPGSGMSGGQNGPRQETRPEKQSMDDWSASASSPASTPHVRGAGGSRSRRITTSRPGWETWA